jgi:hypothetical protein
MGGAELAICFKYMRLYPIYGQRDFCAKSTRRL